MFHHKQKDIQAICDSWLQNASTNLIDNLQMESSIICNQSLSMEHIEGLIAEQMQRFRHHCRSKEDEFIDQMMIDNPIIVERRTPVSSPTSTPTSAPTVTRRTKCLSKGGTYRMIANSPQDNNIINSKMNEITQSKQPSPSIQQTAQTIYQQQQRQRAESCRISRINNKIHKAKTRYRHNFIMTTFNETATLLASMQNMVKQAEQRLLSQGYKVNQLQQLKTLYKIIDDPQHSCVQKQQQQQLASVALV